MKPIRLGISTCLLGENVRYDGGHKLDRFLRDELGRYVEYVPVCPEVECGLPVPREAMRLVGDPASPRLLTQKTKIDHTDRMLTWAKRRLGELEREDLCGYVFKSRSPSSGLFGVKVYDETGTRVQKGVGLFARAFTGRFPLLPAEEEGRLNDAGLRENFIERIFTVRRWKDLAESGMTTGNLVRFHTAHKLLIMAHSRKALTELGRLVAEGKRHKPKELYDRYFSVLMEGMRLLATTKKNTDVLFHAMGYFKKEIGPDGKAELREVIERYHDGLVPLVVPLTLLGHYVRTYRPEYLLGQIYLDPHPAELMLRNHV
ncbi:MAG: DUF523 and DUF1722 domain-containing protein [Candidatus Krumholzibacteria bacterium]|nr:DUF523 and DUF1722 domain-containing protein [Candidatus Krumholzibacteria bacterium]